MSEEIKFVEDLSVADLKRYPVWEYLNDDEIGETAVRPVKELPAKSLSCSVVGTQIQLANHALVWALIGNVDSNDPRRTQQFLVLSVFQERWFHLARYFDFDFNERGPHGLADFLRLPVNDVFPITYDLRPFSIGERAALTGTIEIEPQERLTRSELLALSLG
jgi:hypothetical protein